MLIVERQQKLLDLLKARQTASLDELSRELDVSSSTVRRDLEALEKEGSVRRTHGGAVYRGPAKPNGAGGGSASPHPSLAMRMQENVAAKRTIGALAAAMIEPNMTVLMDGGSTVILTAQQVSARPIQVVTNSLSIAQHFKDDEAAEVVLAGGTLYPRTEVTTGPLCRGTLAELHADIASMYLAGVYDDDAFNINMAMASVEQAMKVSVCLEERFAMRSAWICGDKRSCPDDQRRSILSSFRSDPNGIQVVCNVGVLTTGFDFPGLMHIVMARPTKSLTMVWKLSSASSRP